MTRHYTHTLSLSLGGDEPTWEGEATVSYAVTWGAPERGPTYACGGTPADPDEIDDIRVIAIDARPIDDTTSDHADLLADLIEGSDALLSELLQAAAEDDIAAHDDAMERRWEERREA